jgi:hypothetical protein
MFWGAAVTAYQSAACSATAATSRQEPCVRLQEDCIDQAEDRDIGCDYSSFVYIPFKIKGAGRLIWHESRSLGAVRPNSLVGLTVLPQASNIWSHE